MFPSGSTMATYSLFSCPESCGIFKYCIFSGGQVEFYYPSWSQAKSVYYGILVLWSVSGWYTSVGDSRYLAPYVYGCFDYLSSEEVC